MKKDKEIIHMKIYKNDFFKKRKLKRLLAEGYKVQGGPAQGGGQFGIAKTATLGCLFLPLALLGRKPKYQEYYLKKEKQWNA